MEQKQLEFFVSDVITHIGRSLEGSGMDYVKLEKVSRELDQLANYLNVSKHQAMLFVAVFIKSRITGKTSIKEMYGFIKMSETKMYAQHSNFEELVKRGFIIKSFSLETILEGNDIAIRNLSINRYIYDSILANEVINEKIFFSNLTERDFLNQVDLLLQRRFSNEIGRANLLNELEKIEDNFSHLSIISKLQGSMNTSDLRLVLYFSACEYRNEKSEYPIKLEDTLTKLFDFVELNFALIKNLTDPEESLIQEGYLVAKKDKLTGEIIIELSERSIEDFNLQDLIIERESAKVEGLLDSSTIDSKSLFFNEDTQNQLKLLRDAFKEENYTRLKNSLQEQGLSKGITAIFHGTPGTGKTETVYQLAKESGRNIFLVDITKLRSKWYGESEKLIKQLFDRYRDLRSKSEVDPILMINEADSILAQRTSVSNSRTAHIDNSIINIILEEMESFEGILIATTNLVENLDSAFERRFMFKVEFFKPTIESKQAIWRSKLKWIDEESANLLAQKYQFSGGEIDNVVKKISLKSVVYGSKPSLEEVMSFCSNEKFYNSSSRKKIGFYY